MKKLLPIVGFLTVSLLGCTDTAQVKTVSDIAVKIADTTCKELEALPDMPDWVQLACNIERKIGQVEQVVKVLMPRTEWHQILAHKSLPKTPGK